MKMFQNPWEPMAPFNPGAGQQQHVEYLACHPKPDETRLRTVSLLIDNRDRDTGFDAQRGQSAPFNFVARFDPIDDVVSACIRTFSCPKPAGESYVILDIDQFDNRLCSTDQSSHQKFAAVYFDQPSSQTESKPVRTDLISSRETNFKPPINLTRLDVAIRTHGGAFLQASNDTTVSFVLDLTCKELSDTYGL